MSPPRSRTSLPPTSPRPSPCWPDANVLAGGQPDPPSSPASPARAWWSSSTTQPPPSRSGPWPATPTRTDPRGGRAGGWTRRCGVTTAGLCPAFGIAAMQLITSTTDYLLPTACRAPLRDAGHRHPSPHHPISVRGVGESATVGSPAAFVNAVVGAAAHLGVTNLEVPETSARCGTPSRRPRRAWLTAEEAYLDARRAAYARSQWSGPAPPRPPARAPSRWTSARRWPRWPT